MVDAKVVGLKIRDKVFDRRQKRNRNCRRGGIEYKRERKKRRGTKEGCKEE